MSHSQPKLVYGAATIASNYGFDTDDKVQSFLDVVAAVGIDTLDTALIYSDSEEVLGKAKAASRFRIDTKFPGGFTSGPITKESVVEAGKQSLKKLQTASVDVFYQHAPSPQVPLEETLAGIDELYRAGAFKRFGLSNFTAAEVEDVIRVAKAHGFVLPTVYQGNYNAFSRRIEADLFPVLRKHGLAFYAYSPSAGGFLAKTADVLRQNSGTGRWDAGNPLGQLYTGLYVKAPLLDGLDAWNAIAGAENVTGIELAYRWVAHHSRLDGTLGDAVIVGARTPEQLRESVGWIKKGPVSTAAAAKIDALWASIAADAPVDNYNSFFKQTGSKLA
ncbi:aldehyde reductase [Grosmannia clavigera kw1407]|uniref:Aldehyde reductase n=1 Tax=Grosmannia clavigera (strain kw1407 / UAMH 11150) TaxID=655863 RepID=F0XJU5_GROCL|nr:aldehyde reductase [Grosmannia clavigera kw1407]EFX02277.1 aldehyde reductase [Grosmannia clavigera kw1407]